MMDRDQLIARLAGRVRQTGLHRLALATYANWQYYTKHRNAKPQLTTFGGQQSSKIAIFAIYQPNGLSAFCRKQLLYLRKLGYDIALSVPHPLKQLSDVELIKRECRFLVMRENFGRDFGSYRDAIVAVGFDEFAEYERVLLVNDSVYMPLGDTSRFEAELAASKADAIGLCENVQFSAHIGTYFLDMASAVFCNHAMQAFWKSYRPLDSRIHAIHRGEYGISKVIYKTAKSIDILYSQERIVNELTNGKTEALVEWRQLHKILGFDYDDLKNRLLSASGLSTRNIETRNVQVVDAIRKKIISTSPPHSNGLLLLVFFGAPFIKRDIYLRTNVDIAQVYAALSIVETEEVVSKIITDLRKVGTRRNLAAWPLFLNHLGLR